MSTAPVTLDFSTAQPIDVANLPSSNAQPVTLDFSTARSIVPGEQINDVGNRVIVPAEGEDFATTMRRAAAYGKTVTPAQIQAEMATAPKKVATVLGAAPAIGLGGAAALGAGDLLSEVAIKHLAGNVLPGMETAAAKQALVQAVPKVLTVLSTLSKLGIGAAGVTYLMKALSGGEK